MRRLSFDGSERWRRILDDALEGKPPSREDCADLLRFPEFSLEAGWLRATADYVSRRRYGGNSILLGQIGIEISPCPGRCLFCSFGDGHTAFEKSVLPFDDILSRADAFSREGDLYALFLMTMHDFDFDRLLETIVSARKAIPPQTQIVVNVGDFNAERARELLEAGIRGAYHVRRLREGADTALNPEERKKTIRAIRDAGLDWYYCCEPIGPEHSPEEIVEQLFLGFEEGCFQHVAMRRVRFPGSPLADREQITESRLAQIVAVVALAAIGCEETRSIAVHEPNLLGLTSGANVVYAETGANPRDAESETSGSRGLDMAACRGMLCEAGFTGILRGDGSVRPLNFDAISGE